MTETRTPGIVQVIRTYLDQYITFPSPDFGVVAALWAIGTYLWPYLDAYPYLVITSDTKRSGKTRFAELLSFLCANARNMAGMTSATMFRTIRDEQPTLFVDEAETLSSEAMTMMRAVLNVGYRRGQTIPRVGDAGKVEQWPAYCPKAFILIGDVYDTLRDRSIVLRMRRAEAQRRFLFEPASNEGSAIGERITALVGDHRLGILDRYQRHQGLPFLQDRDEEIWTPLFVIAEALAPEVVADLTRIAVDLSTEKTAPARRASNVTDRQLLDKAEADALTDEYAIRLVRDVAAVMEHHPVLYTKKILDLLYAIPTAPWRKFRGNGLTDMELARLLDRFGVKARYIRPAAAHRGDRPKTGRGYRRADVVKAAKTLMA